MSAIIQGHPSVLAERENDRPLKFDVCAGCGGLSSALFLDVDRWKCVICAGKVTGVAQPPLEAFSISAAPTSFDFDVDAIRDYFGSEIAAIAVLSALKSGDLTRAEFLNMAEIVPDEGLNLKLGIFPKNGTNLGTLYLSMFTAFTASTVGSSSQTLSSYTEPDFGSFLVQSVAAADWGSVAAGTGGRKVTAAQKSFPAATSVGSSLAINGYTLRNQSTFSGGVCLGAANFDEGQVPALAVGDIVRVTATWQENN